MEVKIEKNVPIPPHPSKKSGGKYGYLNEVIETWEVGNSVAFKCGAKAGGVKSVLTIAKSYCPEAACFCRKAKEADQKVTQRFIPSEGVIRVWRIE